MAAGQKTSIYLPDDDYARWRVSGISAASVFRKGLDAFEEERTGTPVASPLDPVMETVRRVLENALRDEGLLVYHGPPPPPAKVPFVPPSVPAARRARRRTA